MSNKIIGFGLLGCGRIGQVHAKAIESIPQATLVAVADLFPDAAANLANQYGCKTMSADDIINHPDIPAIIIASPTDTHFDIIHKCCKAGKAIFCEKPVDLDADRVKQCTEAVDKYGIKFMTAFNRRFDANFATLKNKLIAKEVGDVELVTILSRDPAPPPISYIESSGGLFRDMTIHDFDMARFLLGEEPVSVFAVGTSLVDPRIADAGDVDTAAVVLTTDGGKICQISNSRRASYGYDQRIEVHGSKGMIRADNVLNNSVELANDSGFVRAPALNFFLERYAGAYAAEIRHFVNALIKNEAPNPNIIDGLKAQIIADAATKSSLTGQVVKISF